MNQSQESEFLKKFFEMHATVTRIEPKLDTVSTDVSTLKTEMKFAQNRITSHDDFISKIEKDRYRSPEKPIWSWRSFWRDWNVMIALCAGIPSAVMVYNFIVWWLHKLPMVPVPK